jgi:protein phosphatase 2C family protein 2/3
MGDTLGKPVTDKYTTMFRTPTMSLAASGMQGWRKKMEDAHVIDFKIGTDPRAAFMAVFDGHNGGAAAKFCSLNIVEKVTQDPAFVKNASGRRDLAKALEGGFLATDAALRQTEHGDDSGCAAVAVMALEGRLICGNAGDSRAVAYRRDREGKLHAIPLSQDHRPTLLSEVHRIEEAGGAVQHNRVNGVLALTRALGDFEFKKNDEHGDIITARPDITEVPLTRDIAFVVVACDGVWDVVSNEQAGAFVDVRVGQPDTDAGLICEDLLQHCIAECPHGLGTDNMTCVLWVPEPAFFERPQSDAA